MISTFLRCTLCQSYAVTGALFFATSNDLYSQRDRLGDHGEGHDQTGQDLGAQSLG